MAAASRMLIPRLVRATAALLVCSTARRSARGLAVVLGGPARRSCRWPWAALAWERARCGFVDLEPQGRGFTHTGEGLVDGLAPGVDPWFLVELDGPAPVVFPFEPGSVGVHVVLVWMVLVSFLIW